MCEEFAVIKHETFQEWQYKALRDEISQAQTRAFQILLAAVAALPISQFVTTSDNSKLTALVLISPIVIIAVALEYISIHRQICRCGIYIRDYVEPRVNGLDKRILWENWLQYDNSAIFKYFNVPKQRVLEPAVIGAFILLFLGYYTLSLFLS